MICALSQEAPRKGSRSGTSLRLHEHINSANVVIRNWEDYTGERAEIVPKKKKKSVVQQAEDWKQGDEATVETITGTEFLP